VFTPYSPSVSCVLKGQNLHINYYATIYNIHESNILYTGL
jgi:hypothetical protein